MVKLRELITEKLDWDQDMSRMASEIGKVFKYAKIKVLKHVPYKRGYRTGDAALYGAFIHVKDKDGKKTVLPIEIDKKGIIRYAGGPSGWHKFEKIGALNMSHARPNDFLKIKTYARTADYLRQFAKLPGFGQDVIRRKESVDEKINKDAKIQVPGIGMYTYGTLKSKVQRMAKDLANNAKRGNWNKGGKNSIRAFAEMWNSIAEYERNAK
tara:strand:+ start:172 stop:804 length:633 start_codon:yes stop_codon:yes gene_type:complete